MDVQLPNLGWDGAHIKLLDLDHIQSCDCTQPSFEGYMYPCDIEAELADWRQLGLLIFSLIHCKVQTKVVESDVLKTTKQGSFLRNLIMNQEWNDDTSQLQTELVQLHVDCTKTIADAVMSACVHYA